MCGPISRSFRTVLLLSIVVAGCLMMRMEVQFSEEDAGVNDGAAPKALPKVAASKAKFTPIHYGVDLPGDDGAGLRGSLPWRDDAGLSGGVPPGHLSAAAAAELFGPVDAPAAATQEATDDGVDPPAAWSAPAVDPVGRGGVDADPAAESAPAVPAAVDTPAAVADPDPAAGSVPAVPAADPAGPDGAVASPADPLPAPPPPPQKKGHHKRKKLALIKAALERPILYDLPRVKTRKEFIKLLETLPPFATAVEVGPGNGILAKTTLDLWPSCTEYALVGPWDGENEGLLKGAKYRVKKWKEAARFVDAAADLADGHFDYVWLDGRHDYCAVREEAARYWPKLRPGGILGGSNYADAQYARDQLGAQEDWGRCRDGSTHPEAVKGAVDDFRKEQGDLEVYVSNAKMPSWFIQKPYSTDVDV